MKKKIITLLFVLLMATLIANVHLSHNLNNAVLQIYLPDHGDGIGISNTISYWIIGDDEQWTINSFDAYYEKSSLLLLIIFLAWASLVIHDRFLKK